MSYSSIVKKKCKGNCGRYPAMSMNGYCHVCAPVEIKEKLQSKNKEAQKRKNERLRISSKLRALPENKNMVEDKKEELENRKELDQWFNDRAKEMTGTCSNCGGKTTKGNLKYERFSICHILEKSKVKSVATHPLNFIELCFFNKSCHTNMDNKILEMQDMKCWSEIQTRFSIMYPLISKDEYRFIPDVLLESL